MVEVVIIRRKHIQACIGMNQVHVVSYSAERSQRNPVAIMFVRLLVYVLTDRMFALQVYEADTMRRINTKLEPPKGCYLFTALRKERPLIGYRTTDAESFVDSQEQHYRVTAKAPVESRFDSACAKKASPWNLTPWASVTSACWRTMLRKHTDATAPRRCSSPNLVIWFGALGALRCKSWFIESKQRKALSVRSCHAFLCGGHARFSPLVDVGMDPSELRKSDRAIDKELRRQSHCRLVRLEESAQIVQSLDC
eukprot:4594977-Amphidinium_carterae.1